MNQGLPTILHNYLHCYSSLSYVCIPNDLRKSKAALNKEGSFKYMRLALLKSKLKFKMLPLQMKTKASPDSWHVCPHQKQRVCTSPALLKYFTHPHYILIYKLGRGGGQDRSFTFFQFSWVVWVLHVSFLLLRSLAECKVKPFKDLSHFSN